MGERNAHAFRSASSFPDQPQMRPAMKRTELEKRLRQKLASQGVNLEPGSRAERGVKTIARVGADLANAGEKAARDLARAADAARDAIHEATKPRRKRRR